MSSPADAASSSTAAHLFNDGLALILSYLNHEHWFEAARTSRHWISVACGSERQIELHLTQNKLLSTVHTATQNQKSGWKRLFSCASTVELDSLVSPRYNLFSHLTSLRFHYVVLPTMNAFLRVVRSEIRFTSLTSLSIAHLQVVDHQIYAQADRDKSTCLSLCHRSAAQAPPPLHFPPTLTSFEVARYSSIHDVSLTGIHDLIRAIGECHRLTRVVLPISNHIGHTLSIDPLAQLTHLTHLRLYSYSSCVLSRYQTFVSLGKIKSLTELDIAVDAEILVDRLRLLQLRLVRRLTSNLVLTDEMLSALQYNMPLLEELISSDSQINQDLAIWCKFKHLRSLKLSMRPIMNGSWNPPETDISQTLEIMAETSLTHLHLLKYVPMDPVFWKHICKPSFACSSSPSSSSSPPSSYHLTSLEFTSCDMDPIGILLQSDNHSQVLKTQLHHLHALTSLSITDSFPSSIAIPAMYASFDDSTYLPLLTRIYLRGKESFLSGKRIDFIVIEYDEENGVNQVKFPGQTEEEKIVHRGKKKIRSFIHKAVVTVVPGTAASSCSTMMAEPPAPRLIGIELNPGPESGSSQEVAIMNNNATTATR